MKYLQAKSKLLDYVVALFVFAGTISLLLPGLFARARLNLQLFECMDSIRKGVSCPANFDSADKPARYHLARNLLLSGQSMRAAAFFSGLAPMSRDQKLIAFYLGSAYRMMGDEQAALKIWRAADLGSYFIRQGAFTASVNELQTGIELGQGALENYYVLGDVLWDAGRKQDAYLAYSQGLGIDKTNGFETWLARARLEEYRKEWNSAIVMYQNAVELQPGSYTSYIRIANIYRFELHDEPQALVWYRKCVSNAPNYMWGYLLAAEIERQNTQYAKALELAETANKINRTSAAPYLNMGLTWMGQGNTDKAKSAFETAAGLEPNNYWPPFYLGTLAYKNKDWNRALLYLHHSTELNPGYAGSYLLLGRALEQLGRKADAIAAYQHVLKLIPDNAEASAALSRLQ